MEQVVQRAWHISIINKENIPGQALNSLITASFAVLWQCLGLSAALLLHTSPQDMFVIPSGSLHQHGYRHGPFCSAPLHRLAHAGACRRTNRYMKPCISAMGIIESLTQRRNLKVERSVCKPCIFFNITCSALQSLITTLICALYLCRVDSSLSILFLLNFSAFQTGGLEWLLCFQRCLMFPVCQLLH